MLLASTVVFCVLAAESPIEPRLDTLRFHLERLDAIVVPLELQDEKAAKLEVLRQRLEKGATTGDEVNAIYHEMDAVRQWLLSVSVQQPYLAPGEYTQSEDDWILRNPDIELRVSKRDYAIVVETAHESWRFQPATTNDIDLLEGQFSLTDAGKRVVESFPTGYSTGMTIRLSKFSGAPELEIVLTINLEGMEVVFELAAPGDSGKIEYVHWPKAVIVENTAEVVSVIPMMQGMLLPGNWTEEFHRRDLVNSRSLYMPWWGQIRNGHGVQTIIETTHDGGAAYDHPAGGPTLIQPVWYASMDRLGYLRTIRYCFDDDATYVSMAKRYRRYAQETGHWKTLAEKRVERPQLDKVIGRPVIHIGALYHNVESSHYYNKEMNEQSHALQTFEQIGEQLRALHESGLPEAYVHLDGWGYVGYDNAHPDVMPVGMEQGGWDDLRQLADMCASFDWIFAVHDQYRDFYFNAKSFDDRLSAWRRDGSREEHSTWCGGPQTILSPRFAPGYVRRNHDQFAKHGIAVRGAYLDVFAVVPLEESHAEGHPVTRAECAEYRRQCFDILRARGYIVSSEEPVDYLIPALDLVHHGPYAQFGEDKRAGIPVPLFNLVYHDCILLPWSMTELGGHGIPDGDSGRLHCLLNGGLPYVNPGASVEQLEQVKEATDLAKTVGLLEMTNHEFVDGSFRKQRTTFADGTTVTVDFDSGAFTLQKAVEPHG